METNVDQLSSTPLAAGNAYGSNATTIVTHPYTGDYRVDTLLEGLDYRWNASSPLGTRVTVSYSFMTAVPTYGGNDAGAGDRGFLQFTTAQMSAVRQIFARLQTELNISFVEVADTATSYGQIRFGNNHQVVSSGYTWLPNSTGDDASGDVWINQDSTTALNPSPGNAGWEVLVHEIGHSLGMKHPGNYNAGASAGAAAGNYLGAAEDNTNYTVMSYNDASGGQLRDWYGMYDLLTLKTLYGAGSYGAGDTTYRYTDSSGTVLGIIDDASGTDTIDVSAVTTGTRVDMHAGAFSSVGRKGASNAVNNLSIDVTTTVENFVGGAGPDLVVGNDVANRFTLGGGINQAAGGGGIDTAVYSGARSSYTVAQASGTITVQGTNVSDTLTSVERVEFADAKYAFDTAATNTAKILGAVFGAAAVSNTGFVTTGLALFDGGMSYQNVIDLALNVKLGASASNGAIVDMLYTNVMGTAPDAASHAYYTALLDNGTFTRDSLAILAADTVQNAAHVNLVGLAAGGLAYA